MIYDKKETFFPPYFVSLELSIFSDFHTVLSQYLIKFHYKLFTIESTIAHILYEYSCITTVIKLSRQLFTKETIITNEKNVLNKV